MSSSLSYIFHSGKNSKLPYFLRNFIRYAVPQGWCRLSAAQIEKMLDGRADKEYILDRVNYYCKLDHTTPLPADAPALADHKYGTRDYPSVYFFDTYEFTRHFPKSLHWCHCFGDVTFVPDAPSIVKSRPLCDDNANSVVLNLDKVRHFVFIDDNTPFESKEDKAIFRGEVRVKERRIEFMKRYFGNPRVEAGDVTPDAIRPRYGLPEEWRCEQISLFDHLKYKFILALEGNDVASNLKWVMSSRSLAVMPRPTCETWFMEGRLVPNVHYVEINPDYSDLEERMQYYIDHPAEANEIIRNAHAYIDQFRDKKRERLISLLVLKKYFEMTGQGDALR